MTSAESPQHLEPERSRSQAASEPASELPGSLKQWVASFILWPVVDEPAFRLVARCFGDGCAPEWDFLTPLLPHAGLVEPGPAPGTFTCWAREDDAQVEVRHAVRGRVALSAPIRLVSRDALVDNLSLRPLVKEASRLVPHPSTGRLLGGDEFTGTLSAGSTWIRQNADVNVADGKLN